VVIGDGAPWIWNLTEEHFPGAVQVVDLYHARQHLGELSGKLWPTEERRRRRWMSQRQKQLDGGRIESLVRGLRSLSPASCEAAELVRHTADYFAANAQRMRYPTFRRQHLCVGSGVVEAGCKTLIGNRLKRSGMFWTVRGANAIIALRCNRLSGKFEDYWESRHARAA
jgi:transposase